MITLLANADDISLQVPEHTLVPLHDDIKAKECGVDVNKTTISISETKEVVFLSSSADAHSCHEVPPII